MTTEEKKPEYVELAIAAVQLLEESAGELKDQTTVPAFWELIRIAATKRAPEKSRVEGQESRDKGRGPTPAPPMDDAAAARWERNTVMPWGKYAGKRVADVPIGYLDTVNESKPTGFNRQLQRFCASQYAERQRKAAEHERPQ